MRQNSSCSAKLFKGIKENRWNIDASIVNILPSPDKKLFVS
jgi:hypothetical protein